MPTQKHFMSPSHKLLSLSLQHTTQEAILYIEAPPLIPDIAADPEHVPHTNQGRPPLLNLHPVLAEQQ